jgi:hypothetical protein
MLKLSLRRERAVVTLVYRAADQPRSLRPAR